MDEQRAGRQLHRYRARIAQLAMLLRRLLDDCETWPGPIHHRIDVPNELYREAQAARQGTRVSVVFRPLLTAGMVADSADGPLILVDLEQSEPEQVVALWHETLHMLGLKDEDQVEALAQKLSAACPEILAAVKALCPRSS